MFKGPLGPDQTFNGADQLYEKRDTWKVTTKHGTDDGYGNDNGKMRLEEKRDSHLEVRSQKITNQ